MREAALPRVIARREPQQVMGNGHITQIVVGGGVRNIEQKSSHAVTVDMTASPLCRSLCPTLRLELAEKAKPKVQDKVEDKIAA